MTADTVPVTAVPRSVDVDADRSHAELARIAAQTAAAIAACERDMKILQGRLVTLRKIQEVLADSGEAHAGRRATPTRRQRRSPEGSTSEAVRQAVAGILKEAGRPMKRGELLEHVVAAGIDLGSERPERKLSKILSMSKSTFENAGNGYWLAGMPLPGSARP